MEVSHSDSGSEDESTSSGSSLIEEEEKEEELEGQLTALNTRKSFFKKTRKGQVIRTNTNT